jgi:hypothetical protein
MPGPALHGARKVTIRSSGGDRGVLTTNPRTWLGRLPGSAASADHVSLPSPVFFCPMKSRPLLASIRGIWWTQAGMVQSWVRLCGAKLQPVGPKASLPRRIAAARGAGAPRSDGAPASETPGCGAEKNGKKHRKFRALRGIGRRSRGKADDARQKCRTIYGGPAHSEPPRRLPSRSGRSRWHIADDSRRIVLSAEC